MLLIAADTEFAADAPADDTMNVQNWPDELNIFFMN